MFITTVRTMVDVIKEGAIVIDPSYIPEGVNNGLLDHLNERGANDCGCIEIRYQTHPYKLDFTEFMSIPAFTADAIEALNDNKPFSVLRAYIFSELEETMFMVDFKYNEVCKDTEYRFYVLDEITVYDTRDSKSFKNVFRPNDKSADYGMLMYDTVGEILEGTIFIENTRVSPVLDHHLNAGINI